MKTTTRLTTGIAALTIAGLSLTGCSLLDGGGKKKDEGPKALTIDGSFVYAPVAAPEDEETEEPSTTTDGDAAEVDPTAKAAELGDLYTLTVTKGEGGAASARSRSPDQRARSRPPIPRSRPSNWSSTPGRPPSANSRRRPRAPRLR